LRATIFVAVASAAVSAPPALAGDGAATAAGVANTTSETRSTPAAPAVSGLLIHIDPRTGALLREPDPNSVTLQFTPALRDAIATSHDGLVEEQLPGPHGGVKVHLQGRFRNPLMATTDGNGKLTIQHLREPAEPGAAK
jgi:hypothetical protein